MTKPTRDRGASAVEFALILPLLVFFIFGIIEFGFYVYNHQVITNASREGARAGIVQRNPRLAWDGTCEPCPATGCTSIDDVVCNYTRNRVVPVSPGLTPGDVNVTSTGGGYNPTAPFGNELIVTVTYQYPFIVMPNIVNFFFSGTMPNTYTLTAVTVMRYE